MRFLSQEPIGQSDSFCRLAVVQSTHFDSGAPRELLKNRLRVLAILRRVNNDFPLLLFSHAPPNISSNTSAVRQII